jgi:hypothetical protein
MGWYTSTQEVGNLGRSYHRSLGLPLPPFAVCHRSTVRGWHPRCPQGTWSNVRRGQNLDLIFSLQFERAVNRDNTVSFQHPLADRSGALASHSGGLHGAGPSASRWHSHHHSRTAAPGTLQRGRQVAVSENGGGTGCGKDAGWKSPKTDFPTPLGNPAKCAGFPLSHNLGYGWLIQKPDRSCATKTGHFNLLRTVTTLARRGFSATTRHRSSKN